MKWSDLKWSEKTKQKITTAKQKQTKSKPKTTTTTNKQKQHTQKPDNKAQTEQHLQYIYIYEESGQPKRDQTEFLLLPYLAGLHGSDLFDSLLVWFNAKVYVQGNADL